MERYSNSLDEQKESLSNDEQNLGIKKTEEENTIPLEKFDDRKFSEILTQNRKMSEASTEGFSFSLHPRKQSFNIFELKIPNTQVIFRQPTETSPAKSILVHIPDKEIFMSTLHPAAALYEDVTDEVEVKKCFDELYNVLKEKNIELITVRSALKLNHDSLKKLAFELLNYKKDEKFLGDTNEDFEKYVSDDYKRDVISKLSENQLIDVILNKPTLTLKPTNLNTFIESTSTNFDPLGNLIFCRDQQITTQKGVVIGRARSSQRAGEHKIMKTVFENLHSNLLGVLTEEYDKNAYLEGGDFYVAKKDLSMLGVGLRTSIEGADYLMSNDFLGTRYLAIVYDNEDLDQQRMHLDTYFNFLSDKYVIVLDFDEVQTHYKNKKIGRKVYLFDNDPSAKKIKSDDDKVINESGNYKLVKIYDKFYDFLEEKGYKMIKVTHKQQQDYLINFLNIGNNTVLSVTEELKEVAKNTGVKVIALRFRHILNMYGAMHCITQVSRVD